MAAVARRDTGPPEWTFDDVAELADWQDYHDLGPIFCWAHFNLHALISPAFASGFDHIMESFKFSQNPVQLIET